MNKTPSWRDDFRRDITVFSHLFPWKITFILFGAIFATAALFQWSYNQLEPAPDLSLIKAVFAVINMIFLELAFSELPLSPRLDLFAVFIPLIGLPLFSVFGIRVINALRIFFLRAERGQEWQEALVRYTVERHIIVCGLGRVGYRVATRLVQKYGKPVVAINETQSPLVEELMGLGVPVIVGNLEEPEVLLKAGLDRAEVVIACTDSDWINLETAVRARKLKPTTRIVLRQFEDDLTEAFQRKFQVDAVISRSAVAALTFVYAAIGGEILETFELNRQTYVLTCIPLEPTSPLLGRTIGGVADEQDVTVVAHYHHDTFTVEPALDVQLMCYDTLFVFTPLHKMVALIEQSGQTATGECGSIIVCGLGNTGYRVAKHLAALSCRVVAVDFEPKRLGKRLETLGVTVMAGDMRWAEFLTKAGVEQAAAIVACTPDDMTNLQIALHARAQNPAIRVVLRIFDDELAEQMRQSLGVNAVVYSTSALAAPDFVAAALNRRNIRSVRLGPVTQSIARLRINGTSLTGLPLSSLQAEEDLTILLHARHGQVNIPPTLEIALGAGDEIVVLATEEKLDLLNQRNERSSP
jgi:Trk K+ transport system NAD-binding subunit